MKFYKTFCIFVLIGLNIYLNSIRLRDISDEFYFWANLIFWLHALPLLQYLYFRQSIDIYPFVGVLGVFLSMSFAIPVFFIHPTSYQVAELTIDALKVSFWGYLIFYLVFFLFQNYFFNYKKIFDPIKVPLMDPKIRQVALFFLSFWFLNKFIDVTFVRHLGSLGIYVYLGTYLVLINAKVKLATVEKFFFYFILIFEYLTRLVDGLLAFVAMFTLFLIIVDIYSTKKIVRTIVLLIFFLLAYVIISPVKMEFREKVWYSDVYLGIDDRLHILNDLIVANASQKSDIDSRSLEKIESENFFWRYSYQASALSLVIRETPQNVPFWRGESYKILSKLIPRVLWPNKPKEDMGTQFGVAYGIIDVFSNTSMNTPILAEMYMNFGFYGVFFGMIIFGILYSFLNQYFNNIRISNIGKVYAIAIIFPFVVHESNFTLVFGNIPLIGLTVYSVMRFYINK
jgi:hypothetical protein